MFCKKNCSVNLSKFTQKQLCRSTFTSILCCRSARSLKKRLWPWSFSVNFVKVFKTAFLLSTYELLLLLSEVIAYRCSLKKVLQKISENPQENTSARVSSFIKLQADPCNFIKKETLAQVFSCEFCEILRTPFFYRTHPVAASVYWPDSVKAPFFFHFFI